MSTNCANFNSNTATENFRSNMRNLLIYEKDLCNTHDHKYQTQFYNEMRKEHQPNTKFAHNFPTSYDNKIRHYL